MPEMKTKSVRLASARCVSLICLVLHASISASPSEPEDEFRQVLQYLQRREAMWTSADVSAECVFQYSQWGFAQGDSAETKEFVCKHKDGRWMLWYPSSATVRVWNNEGSFGVFYELPANGETVEGSLASAFFKPNSLDVNWLLGQKKSQAEEPDSDIGYGTVELHFNSQSFEDYFAKKTIHIAPAIAVDSNAIKRFNFSQSLEGAEIQGHVLIDTANGCRLVEISESINNLTTGDTRTDSLQIEYVIDERDRVDLEFVYTAEGESATFGTRGFSRRGRVSRHKLSLDDDEFELASYGIQIRKNDVMVHRSNWLWFALAGMGLIIISIIIRQRRVKGQKRRRSSV